jgi:hypothetical protein
VNVLRGTFLFSRKIEMKRIFRDIGHESRSWLLGNEDSYLKDTRWSRLWHGSFAYACVGTTAPGRSLSSSWLHGKMRGTLRR